MSFSATKAAPVNLPQVSRWWRAFQPIFKLKFLASAQRYPRAVLIIFLLGLLPSPSSAEILIEPRVGFHGVFQLGRPFPLEIELSNSGRPADGRLEVQVWKGGATKGGAPFAVNYRREVFLAAQSRKSIQLTVDPDFISRPLKIRFTSPTGGATRELDLRRYFSPAPVLLLLSETNLPPPMAALATGQSRLVSIAPAELVADPRALLGVSHLVLYDQSLRELSRGQLNAIDTWISAGGQMIIIGSLNYALYQGAAFSRFLPVRVTGTKQISFTPDRAKDEPSVTLASVWAQVSTQLNGKVLTEADGIPILVEAGRGRGRITYFALDIGRPPLSKWDGLPKFLQTLFTPASQGETTPRSEWSDAVFAQLVNSPSFISTYVPSRSLFIAMIVYLGALGFVPWLGQRLHLTLRALLVGLICLVAASTLLGYFQFIRGGNIPDGVLLSSTVMESSGDGYVEAQANLALFSTQPRPYELEMERGWMELTPVSNRAREAPEAAVVQQDSGGASRYQLPLREWDYRLFRMRLIDRFPMRADFEVQGDKIVMKVNNQSGKDLINCWLLVPGQNFDLGQIPRGVNWSRTFSLNAKAPSDSTSRPEGISFREVTFPDKTRDILFRSSFFARDGDARWAGGVAVFFGWVKEPQARVRVDDPRIQTQDYALFRTIIPLSQGEDE
jgi:hypothetical protein